MKPGERPIEDILKELAHHPEFQMYVMTLNRMLTITSKAIKEGIRYGKKLNAAQDKKRRPKSKSGARAKPAVSRASGPGGKRKTPSS